jgi:hypothetical protein
MELRHFALKSAKKLKYGGRRIEVVGALIQDFDSDYFQALLVKAPKSR